MTKFKRFREIVKGLITITAAVLMASEPQLGYLMITILLSVYLMLQGLKNIFYYFTMAMHMVDGKTLLYRGVILLDFGLLTFTLTDVPHYYILIYLIIVHAFSGFVEILRAYEARKQGMKLLKFKLVHGLIDLTLAILCIICIGDMETAVIIYCVGLAYSSVVRIVSALRRTKFVYIQ